MKLKKIILVLLLLSTSCSDRDISSTELPNQTNQTDEPSLLDFSTVPLNCQNMEQILDELSNTHVVYQGYDSKGTPLMWSIRIGTGRKILLKDYPSTVSGLGFIKDARRFVIPIGDGENVWIGNVDGTPPVKSRITENLLSNFQPYSPMWSEIIGLPREFLDYRFGNYHSPNNEVIASWKSGDEALFLVDRITGNKKEIIVTSDQDVIYGRWSMDSTWYIFSYSHSGQSDSYSQLMRINLDGTKLDYLTPRFPDTYFTLSTISPDGEKVAFINHGVKDSIGILWIKEQKLEFYNLEFVLATSFGNNLVWSPDSEWIAFFGEWEQVDIRVLNILSGDNYCLTNDPIRENAMDWH